jgi:hypothetical protein
MADLVRRYKYTSLLLVAVVLLLFNGLVLHEWHMGFGVSAGLICGGGWIARWTDG